MSLGQRLHKAPEKGASEMSAQDYEASIRRLKLLSKSQTALLKAFLHGKLVEGESVVQKSIDLLIARGGKDSQLEELKRSLQALKIKELEVDVESTKLNLHQELATLRHAVDNGVGASAQAVVGAAPISSGPSAEDLEKLKRSEADSKKFEAESKKFEAEAKKLEAENKTLREQLKDTEARLTESSNAIAKANGNASELANSEIKSLKSQIDALKRDLASKEAQSAEKDTAIAASAKTIATLTSDAQSRSASESSKEQALRSEVEKARADLQQAEAKLAASNKEWESKVAAATKTLEAKVAAANVELARVVADKDTALQEQEARLEAEKDEMMEAMAQEIEEIETTKAAEFELVNQELAASKQRIAVLQNNTKGLNAQLRQLAGVAQGLARDYKAHKSQSVSQLQEMSQTIVTQYKPILTNKLKSIGEELALATTRYRKEMIERKKLHNMVQELKGNIRVYMRCRPPTKKELEQFGDEAQCVSFPNPGEVKVFNEKNREKLWEFDETFDTSTNQEQVYAEVAALVTSVMDGFNVCIFAYGQTGSGKTWTMSGPASDRGVNTRALEDLFNKADSRRREWRDTITVSLLEVYNEEIRDLLADGHSSDKLEVKLGPFGNHVPGLTSLPVDNIAAVLNLITTADRNRSSATTNMNEHSSRSHMILTATIISEYLPTGVVTRGKLNLVDLAGSERINKSGATGQALKEAQNINKSLSALGDVIAARAAKQSHVPFRNSTLTYLLQDSISQDSKTLMIVCVSPVLYNSEETFCSLNFAGRVRTVELGKASKTVTSGANSASNTPPPPPGTSSSVKRK